MTNTNPTLMVVAQPANKGQALMQLINAANISIDIVIYEINSVEIINSLVEAMGSRGVRVRTVMDDSTETTLATNSSFVLDMINAMGAWTQNGKPAPISANLFAPHWSSGNFNVTHQKTVIVDAVDVDGNPLVPLPDTACLLISTGNFADYGNSPFYSATDFYVTVKNPILIEQASAVFNSDFNGDGPTVNNADNGTQSAGGPLIWSNGAWANAQTQDPNWPENQYPPKRGYPYPLPAPSNFTNEGNVAGYLVALVQSAQEGDVLRIYNEELDSDNGMNPLYAELLAAANRGVDVRVMMSYGSGTTDDFAEEQAELARKGGTVTLLAPEEYLEGIAGYTGPTYIHAKAFMLSGGDGEFKQGWVGSTNIGNNSLFSNRELGIAIQSTDIIAAFVIIGQFDSDWGWYNPEPTENIYAIRWTKANVGKSGYPPAPAAWTAQKASV